MRFIALLVLVLLTRTAAAADSSEFWPEANAFITLGPRTRAFIDGAYAQGKESDQASLDFAAYLDISLKPIKDEYLDDDWQRTRYFWARIGYDRIFNSTDNKNASVAENRGIVSLFGKALLPAGVVMEGRVRADLRWMGDDYSSRYRFRIEFTREFRWLQHTVVPFLNYEWFYDTRYDGWARTLATVGPEVTINDRFRYEVYLARQSDRLPVRSDLTALGINLKWYY